MQQNVKFVEKRFLKKFPRNKNHQKVRDHCHYTDKYRGAAHSVWNLRFNVPSKISVIVHDGSYYDYYHFISKELAK